jgi:phosphopantetheine adenylyltransferase
LEGTTSFKGGERGDDQIGVTSDSFIYDEYISSPRDYDKRNREDD